MRALRTSTALAVLLAMAASVAHAQAPSVDQLLKYAPTQKGVEYEIPADAATIAACKVEMVKNADDKTIGYALKDGQGKLLRKFINTDDNPKLDQWSYYADGFEVYRELDLDGDMRIDEIRWLNAGGTRTAIIKGGRVAGWKRISAEEASKVLVMALNAGDVELLETVMASAGELGGLGLPRALVDQAAAGAGQRKEQMQAIAKKLTGWNAQTVWHQFQGGGGMPHLIPADSAAGLKSDVALYENSVIFAGPASGQAAPDKVAYLQVPEMVLVGETWKFVSLPNVIEPGAPVTIPVADSGIRASVFRREAAGGPATDPRFEEALAALAEYDQQNSGMRDGGVKADLAKYYVNRIKPLREVVKAAGTPEEALAYNKQIADSLAEAYQTGLYPDGLKLIDVLVQEGGKIGSFAAFRKLNAEFAKENDNPAANFVVIQKAWMAKLRDFLKEYPKSDEAPEALFQLAVNYEYNAEEEEARGYYGQLVKDHAESRQGKKAAGALRRLDIVGKPLDLKGAGMTGDVVDLARYRGKTVLVLFWASWANPVKRDLPELIKLQGKFRDKGFEVVGVCLDNEKQDAEQFLKENPTGWAQVFEPNGMDSRLAEEFGIISLPTMFLVDADGKVLDRNIRTSSDLETQLTKTLAGATAGVALGNK